MEAPKKIYMSGTGRYSTIKLFKKDDIEYILATEHAALLERHQRLVEAVREWMVRLAAMDIDDEHSCFSTCSLANECDKDSGNECLWVARLRAALEGEG